jgi:hypothetical protein
VSDPIDCDGKAYEAKKSLGQLFITSADSAVAFDAAEKVFHGMTMPIEGAVEIEGDAPGSSRRNAYRRAGVGEVVSECTSSQLTIDAKSFVFAKSSLV